MAILSLSELSGNLLEMLAKVIYYLPFLIAGNKVECSVHINKISDVKEKFQSFTLDLYLVTNWTDYRLNSTAFFTQFTLPDKYVPGESAVYSLPLYITLNHHSLC